MKRRERGSRTPAGSTSFSESTALDDLLDPSLTRLVLALVDEITVRLPRGQVVIERESSPPVPAGARLVTRYGTRPGYGPGEPSFHCGVDFKAPRGTEVFAVRPGVVARVIQDTLPSSPGASGCRSVVLHHDDEDRWTVYSNLGEVMVAPGAYVLAGQRLGQVGLSSTRQNPSVGNHLHFEVLERALNGSPPRFGPTSRWDTRDPVSWLRRHGIRYNGCGRLLDTGSDQRSCPSTRAHRGREESPQ